jgi:F420-0:gamma-glutamyl ligase-like protein
MITHPIAGLPEKSEKASCVTSKDVEKRQEIVVIIIMIKFKQSYSFSNIMLWAMPLHTPTINFRCCLGSILTKIMVANKPQRIEELTICFTTSDIQEAMVLVVMCCGTKLFHFRLYVFTLATLHLRHYMIS